MKIALKALRKRRQEIRSCYAPTVRNDVVDVLELGRAIEFLELRGDILRVLQAVRRGREIERAARQPLRTTDELNELAAEAVPLRQIRDEVCSNPKLRALLEAHGGELE